MISYNSSHFTVISKYLSTFRLVLTFTFFFNGINQNLTRGAHPFEHVVSRNMRRLPKNVCVIQSLRDKGKCCLSPPEEHATVKGDF